MLLLQGQAGERAATGALLELEPKGKWGGEERGGSRREETAAVADTRSTVLGSSCGSDSDPGSGLESKLQQPPVPQCLALKSKMRVFFPLHVKCSGEGNPCVGFE